MPIGITSTTSVSVEATQKGFEAVGKAISDLSTNIQKTFGQSTAVTSRLTATMDQMRGSIDAMSTSVKKTSDPFMAMDWSIKSITDGMMRLAQFQIRWYATRFILFDVAQGFAAAAKEAVSFANDISMATANFERWLVMAGQTTGTHGTAEQLTLATRRAALTQPLPVKEVAAATESFVGAGVKPETVLAMTEDIAKLKSAFKEIPFDTFALAVTGAFNVFHDKLGEGLTDAEKFRKLLDQIITTSAVSVIRPENFTKVIQYLGEIGKISGFTTERLFSFAGALANTSIPAANASRLLAGVFVSLSNAKTVDSLNLLGKQIGITIDKGKSLGENFDNILKILARLQEQGVKIETMDFIRKLVPADRMKVLLALIDQMKEVEKIYTAVTQVTGAKGLDIAAQIMQAPPERQWQIFKNVLAEVSVNVLSVQDSLGKALVTILDVARGTLAAVDSEGKFAEQTSNLGGAGKKVYDVLTAMKGPLGEMKDLFLVLLETVGREIGAFISLIDGLSKVKIITIALDAALSALILKTIIGTVFPALSKLAWVLATEVFGSFFSVNKALSDFSIGLDKGVASISIWVAVLTAGLFAINLLFDQLNKSMDELEGKMVASEAEKMLSKATSATIGSVMDSMIAKRSALQYQRNQLLQQMEEIGKAGVSTVGYNQQLNVMEADLREWNFQIARAQSKMAEFSRTPATKKEKGLDLSEDDKFKSTLTRQLSAVSGYYKDKVTEAKTAYDTEVRLEEDRFRLGEDSADQYYKAVSMYSDKYYQQERILGAHWRAEINALYDDMEGEANRRTEKNKGDRQRELTAVSDERKRANEDVNKMSDDAEKVHQESLSKAHREATQERAKIALDALRDNKAAESFIRGEMLKDFEASMKNQEKILDDMYRRGSISATVYYSTLKSLNNDYRDQLINNLQEEFDVFEDVANKEMKTASPKDKIKIQEQIVQAQRDLTKQVNQINREGAQKDIEQEQSKLHDYQDIWEDPSKGLVGVWNEVLVNMYNKAFQWGNQLAVLFEDVCKGLADTFDTVFIDLFEGHLKTAGEYFNAFAKSIYTSMAKILSQQIAMSMMMGATSLGDWGLTSLGNSILGFKEGGIVGSYKEGGIIPSFQIGGEMGDARYAKVHVGERVLSTEQNKMFENMYSQVMQGATGPNVQFNLYNQSSQPVTSTVRPPKFDGEKWVVNAWINDYMSNGPTRKILGGA